MKHRKIFDQLQIGFDEFRFQVNFFLISHPAAGRQGWPQIIKAYP